MTPTAVEEREERKPENQAFASLDERYERLPMDSVVPSKTNPRTHFDNTYLHELAGSIAEKGVVQPILVRQLDASSHKPMRFEIVAGECRYRASKIAKASHIPAVIRLFSDEQVLELQLIENIHRKDLTALEQAAGYRRLIDTSGGKHTAASIAQRLGMSEAWVWDRMKLNDLIPEAKKILEQDLMTVGHAILVARLKPEDQKRVIDVEAAMESRYGQSHGLWQPAAGFLRGDEDFDGKKGKYDHVKAVTVRELQAWIDDHIRFDVEHAAKAQPLAFEGTKAKVEEAAAEPGRGRKIVAITNEYRVADDARDESERTYGSQSWERADGQQKSKTCEFSVLGVVVAGEGRGDTFEVCVNREKCTVHFGQAIKQKAKNAKLRESGQSKKASRNEATAEAKRQREAAAQEEKHITFERLKPALRRAADARIESMKTVSSSVLALALKALNLPVVTAAKLPAMLLETANRRRFERAYGYFNQASLESWNRGLGVDVKAVTQSVQPKAEAVQSSGVKAKKSAKSRAAA